MKRVIVYGTFDLLHFGHIQFLEQAKSLGDELIVGLSTDEFNSTKGKISYFDYEQRKIMLENLKFVDKVIPEESWGQKESDIKKYNIDVVAMGSDWQGDKRFEKLRKLCDVEYIYRPHLISTTVLKNYVNFQFKQK